MISVLIVTRNNQREIGACISSLPWGKTAFELLIEDNGSTDGTREAVESFVTEKRRRGGDLRAHWNASDTGYSAAVNRMLSASRGEWICLLGPDTSVRPGALEALAGYLEKNPAAGAAAPKLVDRSGVTQRSCRRFPTVRDAILEMSGLPRLFPRRVRPRWKLPEFDYASTASVEQPEATCLMVRRRTFEMVGPMDERFRLFFNDVDWCRRIRESGWDIVFLPAAVVGHVGGASVNRVPVMKIWKSHQGFYRYFAKYRRSAWGKATNPLLGGALACTAVIRAGFAMLRANTGKKT